MIFSNISILDENFEIKEGYYVEIKGDKIVKISHKPIEKKACDGAKSAEDKRIYDGKGKLLMPGFVNNHAHAPMSLMRGYGENMSLENWLFNRIFPFEDQLTAKSVFDATLLSMAESIRYGIVSTSEMYYFMDAMAEAIAKSGIKANISRSITHFDDSDFLTSYRADEMRDAYKKHHNTLNGRLLLDMSLHAEYTTTPKCVEQLASYTKEIGANMQLHVSETKKEHEECKERHGKTPVKYLSDLGLFDTKATAAHCVWIEGDDYSILRDKGVTVCVNPISNLKLASGICDITSLAKNKINITIGTDSVASNNSLNFFEEIKTFALLSKVTAKTEDEIGLITPQEVLRVATRNGMLAQGRSDSGLIKEGYKADLIVLDIDAPNMKPVHDLLCNIVYSADPTNLLLTMVDGRILYENGEYKTIDIEKVIFEAEKSTKEILAKV